MTTIKGTPRSTELAVAYLVLDELLANGPEITVTGRLADWHHTRGWASGSLIGGAHGQTDVRLPIYVAGHIAAAVTQTSGAADGATVTIGGRWVAHRRWGPARVEVTQLTVVELVDDTTHQRRSVADALARSQPPIATRPGRIALVSPTSSEDARRDLLEQLAGSGIDVEEIRVAMVGPEAAAGVAAAITRAGTMADAVVVIRGGGNPSDLAVFDTIPVLDATALCAVPVIVAIGHATNHPSSNTSPPVPTQHQLRSATGSSPHHQRQRRRFTTTLQLNETNTASRPRPWRSRGPDSSGDKLGSGSLSSSWRSWSSLLLLSEQAQMINAGGARQSIGSSAQLGY